MKKSLLVAAVLASTGAMAQLPAGSICPDFTGTDINGVSHHLYGLLDQGYTVVIDVSATWCGPCWNYHNSGNLENLYNTYGPGTAEDKVRVLFIEGDGATTLADLNGTGGNTQGNWVANTPYPIIDNATIANQLQISYFPTIYTVCPNRRLIESGQTTTANMWSLVQAPCNINGANLGLVGYNGATSTCGVEDMQVTLQNLGSDPVTSANVVVKQGTTTIATQNWSGNLNTFGTANVTFPGVTITNAPDVTVNITTPDVVAADNVLDPNMVNAAPVSWTVTVEGKMDGYPTEFSWRMLDPNGVEVAQGGNFNTVNENNYCNGTTPASGGYAANATFTQDVQLTELGCYKVQAFDSYGDGLIGSGYFRVRNSNNLLVVNVDYYCSSSSALSNDAVGMAENTLDNGLSIFPNPTNGLVNVTFKLKGNDQTTLRVYDVLGQEVINTRVNGTGDQTQVLDMSGMENGVYYMQLQSGAQKATRKITLAH